MNENFTKLCFAALTALLVSACEPDAGSVDSASASAGRADFSVFVAVGDSLTAGYADGALYRQIQENSFPLILARQFAEAGGGEFLQPNMSSAATGSLTFMGADLGRVDRLMLGATGDPDDPVAPETIMPTVSTAIDVPLANAGGYHNLGVPGAKSFHLGEMGYGNPFALPNANPYFARFASGPTASMLDDAAGLAPSFFILWVGGNDILLYALDGGTLTPAYGVGTENITDPSFFTSSFNAAIAALKTPNNKGLVINVPDAATIPHFTAVPYDAIPLSEGDANDLNTLLSINYDLLLSAALGLMLIDADEAERRRFSYKQGLNPILISDDSLTDLAPAMAPGQPLSPLAALLPLAQARPATEDDYVLIGSASKLGEEAVPGNSATVWGVTLPLEDADVLTKFEYDQMEVARVAYNMTIKAAADADDDILFYDAAARLEDLNQNGVFYGTGAVTAEFGTGNFYSLDGVHPTGRGYAIIANEIMGVIEQGFGASLRRVDPNDFPSVFYQ